MVNNFDEDSDVSSNSGTEFVIDSSGSENTTIFELSESSESGIDLYDACDWCELKSDKPPIPPPCFHFTELPITHLYFSNNGRVI